MQLDPLDAKLLRLLRGDARLSFRDLAERTVSSVPTVSARVRALEDLGVIRGYRAEVDYGLGAGTLVQLALQAAPSEAARVADRLAQLDGVEDVALLAGGHVAARVRLAPPARTLQTLHDAIAQMPGVAAYEAREVLSQRAGAPPSEVPERLDVACHQCHGPIHAAPVRKAIGGKTHVFCCRQCLADFAERYERARARAASAPGSAASPKRRSR